jgi:hypothetical protein
LFTNVSTDLNLPAARIDMTRPFGHEHRTSGSEENAYISNRYQDRNITCFNFVFIISKMGLA